MMIDEGEDGAGVGRRGGGSCCGFSSSSCRLQDRVFSCLLQGSLGLLPAGYMRWQTGPLCNRSGVEPVRLNTVYAFNRLLLPAGLEPGTSPTIPSRQDLPALSCSPPSTCRQARRFPCMSWYHLVWSSNILSIVRAQIRPRQANVDDKSTYPSCFILPCSMGLQNYATSSRSILLPTLPHP